MLRASGAEKEGAEQILAGTFEFPASGDPYMKDVVEEMRMEERVRAAGPISTSISREEHNLGWKKQNKRMASVRAGLSFSDHKAAIEDDEMAEIDRLFREIPIQPRLLPGLKSSHYRLRNPKKAGCI